MAGAGMLLLSPCEIPLPRTFTGLALPAPRYDIELSVQLFPQGSDDGFNGVTKNMSQTGVLVSGENDQPLGAIVRLKFPEFEWTAQVIWTRDTEKELRVLLGMKFLSLSSEDQKMLVRLLKAAATEG